jgi:hypothetical protein
MGPNLHVKWIRMEKSLKLQAILKDAISKLDEAKIEETISILSRARQDIIKEIASDAITPDKHNMLFNVSALTYLAMLHYYAIGQDTSEKLDSITKLTYLSESLGICNILDAVLLPLLATYPEDKHESSLWTQYGEKCKQEMHRRIGQIINTIQTAQGKEETRIDETIKKIIETVNPGSPDVRTLATELGRRFEAGNFKQARRIYEYVRDEIHYIRDPLPFEDIQSPETTLKRLSGDCEDQAILLCSLLLAIGFETALLFADTDGDGQPDHVYSAVHIPNAPDLYKPFANKKIEGRDLRNWIPLDPTSEDLDFGVITLDNLEIKQAFFFLKDSQQFVDNNKTIAPN